jgi:hypothetical protein
LTRLDVFGVLDVMSHDQASIASDGLTPVAVAGDRSHLRWYRVGVEYRYWLAIPR